MNNIVGIKYIGNKPIKEDTSYGTGAVWKQGQVLNFTSDLASDLMTHKDIFEMTNADANAQTFVSNKKSTNTTAPEVVPYVSLADMDSSAMVLYAKLNFNETLDVAVGDDVLRERITSLMQNATLDEQQDLLNKTNQDNEKLIISLEVDAGQFEAYNDGVVELRLVPTGIEAKVETDADVVGDTKESDDVAGDDVVVDKGAEPSDQDDAEENDPPLDEMIAKLNKSSLLALAKQEKVTLPKALRNGPIDDLRAFLLLEINAKVSK